MLQPASRQSKPASLKILSRPSLLGLNFHLATAGHHHRFELVTDAMAFQDAAAARRSSMRALVQEPMKMRSRVTSWIAACPLSSPCSCQRILRGLLIGRVFKSDGSGTLAPMLRDLAGVGAPGDLRFDVLALVDVGQVVLGTRVGRQLFPTLDRGFKIGLGAFRATRPNSQTWFGRVRSCRLGRPPRSTCCKRSCVLPSSTHVTQSPVYSST